MIRFMIGNGRNPSARMGGRWGMALTLVVAAGLGMVLLAVGVGIALLLAPVVIVAGLIARARLRKILRDMGLGESRAGRTEGPFARNPFQQGPAQADVIEGEFRVVEDEKPVRR